MRQANIIKRMFCHLVSQKFRRRRQVDRCGGYISMSHHAGNADISHLPSSIKVAKVWRNLCALSSTRKHYIPAR